MDAVDFEKLGMNRNEAKVYYGILQKGQATAAELVKLLGIHRNIVYDNLEKLIEKGLVSFIIEGTKKKFIAENPEAIIGFLNTKKADIDKEIKQANEFLPEINKLLGVSKSKQDASIFRGINGMKKILNEIVEAKIAWSIGITNESVDILGETFWKNYNAKKKETKTTEYLLWNSNYINTVIPKNTRSHHRILPRELDQATEIEMWDNKVAIFIYTKEPLVIVIENEELFKTYRKQFDFLWKLSKPIQTLK